ncbi:MAG TPA: outer membrane beta-barrel protein [Candidatus Polarisedimenticolia bacterium]|nr:outer membrane beta-barrel protein [Candidatus Polarisedimenticolia bacterium]
MTFAQALATSGDGLPAGRFMLYPSLTLEYTRDDNITYASADLPASQRVDAGVVIIRPRILVDLPLGENRIVWAYTPQYRDYQSDRFHQSQRFTHIFDLEGSLRAGPALRVIVRDHLLRGTVELQEVDRGGELTFGLVPFLLHEPEADITLDLGPRQGISLIPRYTSSRFSEGSSASFFNYQTRQVEARYNYRLGLPSVVYVYYSFQDTNQARTVAFFGNQGNTGRSAGIGLRRTVNKAVVTQLSAGYETLTFSGGLGKNFAGPVLEASTAWQVSDVTRIDLFFRRQAFQSFFVNNNYYVSQQARLHMLQQLGRNTYWEIAAGYQGSAYADPIDFSVTPETPPGQDSVGCGGSGSPDGRIDQFESFCSSIGVRRRDRAVRLEIGAGYRFLRTLRLFLGYNSERRASNIAQETVNGIIDPFDYHINRLFFRIEAGWL